MLICQFGVAMTIHANRHALAVSRLASSGTFYEFYDSLEGIVVVQQGSLHVPLPELHPDALTKPLVIAPRVGTELGSYRRAIAGSLHRGALFQENSDEVAAKKPQVLLGDKRNRLGYKLV